METENQSKEKQTLALIERYIKEHTENIDFNLKNEMSYGRKNSLEIQKKRLSDIQEIIDNPNEMRRKYDLRDQHGFHSRSDKKTKDTNDIER